MTEQATPPTPPQPGAPVPPGAPVEGMGPAPKAPSVAGGIVKRIIGAVIVAVVIGVGGLAWKYFTGAPETASVGDCLAGGSAEEMKTVKCDDATAEYKIVGKVENKTESEFRQSEDICSAFPTTESGYWEGKKGGTGYVLCLEPVKK
ncbi:hypothetical protein GCM10027290_08930 [Micromonospora sonneratiae]|uniref:Uncharacterized protein n=1 Tax=Micromonospora sonneratiae TaxID=1184706 RepID=A0ABW3YHM7_9ACTN